MKSSLHLRGRVGGLLVVCVLGAGTGYPQTPESPSSLLAQAQAHRLKGEYVSAERLYQQVMALKDRDLDSQIRAYKGLALTYQATQRQQQAFDAQTSAMSSEQELMTQRLEHRGPRSGTTEIVSDESQMRDFAASGN